MGSQSSSFGHGCGRWTLEHAGSMGTTSAAARAAEPHAALHTAVPSPEQMQAVVLMLQEPDHGD